MKTILLSLSLFFCLCVNAQSAEDVVQQFFKALTAKDSETLDQLTLDEMQLHSLALADSVLFTSTTKEKFLEGIKNIPEDVRIEERIFDMTSMVSEHLAQFQVPYEFYVNDNLSHYGTNVLTLLKTDEGWKISYIADTRNKKS